MRFAPRFLVPLLAVLCTTDAAARGPHSIAECEAACEARNVPASCAWLSPTPRRCVEQAVKACATSPLAGPAQCPSPPDLPACGTHHACPFGTLCVDGVCQVVGCDNCTGTNRCDGDKCVVADCAAVTANCPDGFHCEPAAPPFDGISGTCLPDAPGVAYCATNVDCIAFGNFNPTCVQGICTRQPPSNVRCETHVDCARRCARGRKTRLPRCTAAGVCLCADCTSDADCALLACRPGKTPTCGPRGACVCRKNPQQTTTTTTTSTTVPTTTTETSSTTTTLPPNDVCCCVFQIDNNWHCVHAAQPDPWLCYVPWPECCDQPYTVCE